MTDTDRAFPLAWDDFENQFYAWTSAYGLKRTNRLIPGRNFMTDEVMGTYLVAGKVVELAAVTFPNLTERDDSGRLIERRNRHVGVSWLGKDGESVNGGLWDTFAELEQALAAGMPAEPIQ